VHGKLTCRHAQQRAYDDSGDDRPLKLGWSLGFGPEQRSRGDESAADG
jgi:hypothetical protein